MNLIISIVVAGIAGWFAGRLMKGEYGAILNIILGLIGGVAGTLLFSIIGLKSSGSLLSSIIISVVGAVFVIWLYRKIIKK